MKIVKIKGLTKEDIYAIIEKVVKNHANKAFDLYDSDDIQQQTWQILLKQLPGFDLKKIKKTNNIAQALENWLNKVASSRLKNFYRDKSVVPKKNIQTTNIDVYQCPDDFQANHDLLSGLELEDNLDILISELDEEELDILDCLLSGENIGPYYKNKLITRIKEVFTIWANEGHQ